MPNQEDKQRLMHAIGEGNLQDVEQVLKAQGAGDWLDEPDEQHYTPLLKAVELGHSGIVKLLLEYSVDIEKRSRTGNTALLLATYRGHITVVKQLLTALKVNPVNNWSDYPSDGHERVILCQRHEKNGDTLLHAAVYSGKRELLHLLLKEYRLANATITVGSTTTVLRNLPNRRNEIPRDIAETIDTIQQQSIVELLEVYRAVHRPKSQCYLSPFSEEKLSVNPKQNLSAQQQNYIHTVQQEFVRMYRLLGDIATEKVSAPPGLKGKVLQAITVVGELIPGGSTVEAVAQCVQQLGATAQFLYQRHQEGFVHNHHIEMIEAYYGSLTDTQLMLTIQPAAYQVARSCAFDINHVVVAEDITRFARVGVSRLFEYLSRMHSQVLSNDVLWLGFFLGRSGRFVKGITNAELRGQSPEYAGVPLTAEGVYAESGFMMQRGNSYEHWVTKDTKYGRQARKRERLALRLQTWFQTKTGKPPEEAPILKYGYVQVTAKQWKLLKEHYGTSLLCVTPAQADKVAFQAQSYRWHALTEKELRAYISYQQSDNNPSLSLNEFIRARYYPAAAHCQAVFDGRLDGSRDAVSLNVSCCDFSGSDFSLSTWTYCRFEGVINQQTLWVDCRWENMTIVGGEYGGSVFDGTRMTQVAWSQAANMQQVKLRYVKLEKDGCCFEGLDNTLGLQLEGTDLVGSGARVSFQSSSSEMEEALVEVKEFNEQLQSSWHTVTDKVSQLQQEITEIQGQLQTVAHRVTEQAQKIQQEVRHRRQHSQRLGILEHDVQDLKQDLSSSLPRPMREQCQTWRLPRALPEDLFLERPGLLEMLVKQLTPQQAADATTAPTQVVVLQGMPGSGKTELAKYLIHHPVYDDYFRGWLSADNCDNLLLEYQRLAQTMGWCEQGLPKETLVTLVHERLAQIPAPGWLLVFDNVDNDLDEIEPLLPTCGGMILVTSRRDTWQGRAVQVVKVGLLEIAEGVALLGCRRKRAILEAERVDAQALVAELGYLPLAITQAGAYLSKHPLSIGEYRQRFKDTPQLLLADRSLGGRANQAVATTWRLSLKALEEQSKEIPVYGYANNMLRLCAYLQAEGIPKRLLKHWFENQRVITKRFGLLNYIPFMNALFEVDKRTLASEFQTLMDGLVEYALLSWEEGEHTVSMHRLLQTVLRAEHEQTWSSIPGLSTIKQQGYWSDLLELFLEAFARELAEHKETLRYQAQLATHGEQALKYLEGKKITLWKLLAFYFYCGSAHYAVGRFNQARHHWKQTLEIGRMHYGEGAHPVVANSLDNLGGVCYALGDLKQAQAYLEQALTMHRILYGERAHPAMASSLSNLGLMCKSLGDLKQAQKYYEQALTMYRTLYGECAHPAVASSLSNLGLVCKSLGDLKQAQAYYEQALGMRRTLYGECAHPAVANSLSNLGGVCLSLGDLKQAQAYYEQALGMRRTLYGEGTHPDMASSLHDLGMMCRSLGDLKQAQVYLEQALTMYRILYGEGTHPDIASSLGNLGLLYRSLGDLKQAQAYLEQTLMMHRILYGEGAHPDMAKSLHGLGLVCRSLGDLKQAQAYLEQASAMERALHERNVSGCCRASLVSTTFFSQPNEEKKDTNGLSTDDEMARATRLSKIEKEIEVVEQQRVMLLHTSQQTSGRTIEKQIEALNTRLVTLRADREDLSPQCCMKPTG